MVFQDSAELAGYYEKNRKKMMKKFLMEYEEQLIQKELFSMDTRKMAEEFIESYLETHELSLEGCTCQLSKIAYMLLFSIQDEVNQLRRKQDGQESH